MEEFLRKVAEGTEELPPTLPQPAEQTVREFDAILDALFADDQIAIPSSASTYSREDIYSDHD